MGPEPNQTSLLAMQAANEEVLSVCGVPAALISASSDGTSRRESWRLFLAAHLQPLVRRLEYELNRGLETKDEIKIDISGLMQSDLASRARAFSQLVKSNVPLDRAAAITGLLMEDNE